jgi:hypothetical protein
MANTLVKVGLFGGAAFVAWKAGWLDFIMPKTTPATPAPAAPNPNAIQGANTLDGIYARLAAAAPSGSHGVDEWNAYLASVMPSDFTPPDPMPIFQAAVSGFDRSQNLTAGQYWNVMAPWLKKEKGLSGLGPRGLGWMAGMR